MPDLIVIPYKHNIINYLGSFLAAGSSHGYFGENRSATFPMRKIFLYKSFFLGLGLKTSGEG